MEFYLDPSVATLAMVVISMAASVQTREFAKWCR